VIGIKAGSGRNWFFDSPRVLAGVDRARRRVLSRFGAFLRTAARSSIRKRKGASAPGKPPSSHTGILRRFLFFAWDPFARSVVVGPAAVNQVFFGGDGKPLAGGTVPEVLERGGSIHVLEWLRRGQWSRVDLRRRRRIASENYPTRLRRVSIAARPYMGPALEQERPRLAELWRDSVKAA
jgi:hypothetical protein